MTSFVHPERVPQMADAEAVVAGLTPHDDVVYAALVLNERGYDRALAAGIREVNTVVITTETFSQRNQGMSVAEAVEVVSRIRARAAADGIRVTVTISAAFGCPFEGEVPLDTLTRVATQVAAIDADEIVLADTIGVAVPSDVEERIAVVREIGPRGALRAHFHNTRNTAVANVVAAVRSGVTAIDASLAGIGGCPFAPAATGNVATEDLVYALERMGLRDRLRPRALDRRVRAGSPASSGSSRRGWWRGPAAFPIDGSHGRATRRVGFASPPEGRVLPDHGPRGCQWQYERQSRSARFRKCTR